MISARDKLLAEVKQIILSKNIDDLVYADYLIEYTIPEIAKFIDWKKILDSPSVNSSKKTFNELNYVIKETTNRSTEDEKLLLNIDNDANYVLNQFLDKNNIVFPLAYFKEFYNIIKPFLYNTKFYFNRLRPYNLAKIYNLQINVLNTGTHNTPAYPSGHVVYTNLASNIIADLYPKYRKQLNNIVQITSRARIQQGVHYPSDCEAGIKLSNYLFEKLHPKLRIYYNDTLS